MSELEELQRPLEERELAEFFYICRKYLNPKGMMILRRLAFTCEQAAKRIAELERQLAEAQKDAERWIMFCELWCHSTVLECRQDEEGTWSILQIEPVENVVFGALVGETPSKTIDAAIRRYCGSP